MTGDLSLEVQMYLKDRPGSHVRDHQRSVSLQQSYVTGYYLHLKSSLETENGTFAVK